MGKENPLEPLPRRWGQCGLLASAFILIVSMLVAPGSFPAATEMMLPTATQEVCQEGRHPPRTNPKIKWCYIDLAGGKVRLWWQLNEPLAEQAGALAHTEIERTIWPRLVALWGKEPPSDFLQKSGKIRLDNGGSAALDISFYETLQAPTTTTAAGQFEAYEEDGCSSPQAGYISLNATALRDTNAAGRVLDPRAVRNILVHEMTHAFQGAFPIAGGAQCLAARSYVWMTEAVASWSPLIVYPHEPAHEWAHLLLDTPQKRLDFLPSGSQNAPPEEAARAYAGYLFFLFLSDSFGAAIPVEAWKKLDTHTSIDAVDQTLAAQDGLGPNWVRFTQWLWNGPPYERLKGIYGLPRGAITVGTAPTGTNSPVANKTMTVNLPSTSRSASLNVTVSVDPLSQQYHRLVVTGTNVRTLTFRPPAISEPFFAISTILIPPGQLPPATLTWRFGSRYVCLEDQPLAGVVLMFSAGTVEQHESGDATVFSSNSCAAPQGVSLQPASPVTGGAKVTATVTIDRSAPPNGVELVISNSAPGAANSPPTVIVPQGTKTTTFTIDTRPVDKESYPVISISRARELAITKEAQASVVIRPATVQQVVAPASIQAGQAFAASVILNAPAGPNGVTVSLQGQGLTPPPSVVVAAGKTAAQFTVTANPTGCQTACERSAQLVGSANGSLRHADMTRFGPP